MKTKNKIMKDINIKDLTEDQLNDLEKQINQIKKDRKKKIFEERFLELIDVNNMVKKRDFKEYPEVADFWIVDGEVIAEHRKNGRLFFHYHKVWSVLGSEYSLNYNEVRDLIKDQVEKHFDLKGVTPKFGEPRMELRWKSISI